MKSLAIATCLLAAACQTGDETKKERPPTAAAPAAKPAAAGRPAGITADDMETVDAMAAFLVGLRDAIEKNKSDCERIAAALAPVIERGKPLLDQARAIESRLAGDQAAKTWIQARIEEKTGGFEGILRGLEGCADHPAVRKALEGFIE